MSQTTSLISEDAAAEQSPPPYADLGTVATPLFTIRASPRWAALNLRELWQYRDLLLTLAERDVKLRYRQTALGVVWVILQPLLGALIFAFVFGRVANLSGGGVPYIVFAYAGLLGWNAFNSTLTKASSCIVGNAHLVSKVFFPRLILPLSTVLSTLIDFIVAMSVMVVLLTIYGITPGWGILLLPAWLSLLVLFAVGMGLYTSALMVSYRDLQYAIPVLVQFLLYASPVAYSVSEVPQTMRWAYSLNPLVGLLEAFRWSLLGVGQPQWSLVAYSSMAVLATFVLGAIAFKRMERKFSDVI